METTRDSVDSCIVDAIARYPEIDPTVEGVVDRVAAVAKYCKKVFEETLAGFGLSFADYKVLLQLAVTPDARARSAGELSRALMLTSGGMTNRLDRLEKAGFLRRISDPGDRRGVLVELTAEGQELIDRAVADEASKEIDLFRTLSESELGELNALLRRVLFGLEERFGPQRLGPEIPEQTVDVAG